MAFCGKHALVCVLAFSCSGIALSFVKVDCDKTTVGQFAHQSLLNCVVKPIQATTDINIILVKWKKLGEETHFLDFKKDERFNQKPGYRFAEPLWDYKNMNVSLLIADTKVTDEGQYTCEVVTDVGICTGSTSLKVTARYIKPVIIPVKERETPNANEALNCRTSGGYPEGKLRWFDDNKEDWTVSSKLDVKKMDNGLLELSSTLPLLPGSTFSQYTCVVLNSNGGNESETSILMNSPPTSGARKSPAEMSNIIAGVVVIGSLIVGLLLVLLIRRRRSQQARRLSSTPLMGPHREIPTDDCDGNCLSDSKA